jgi:hypothetical protein
MFRSGAKFVVGTQQGVLAVFDRAQGWADCVDRVPGHPSSVDALAVYPHATDTVLLTGSSDGLLRAVQLYPTKLLGALADHGDFPIERVRVAGRWAASVGHEEAIKMTDLKEAFEDEDAEMEGADDGEDEDTDSDDDEGAAELDGAAVRQAFGRKVPEPVEEAPPPVEADSDDEDVPKEKKRKRKEADPMQAMKRKKGRDQMDADRGFFSGL